MKQTFNSYTTGVIGIKLNVAYHVKLRDVEITFDFEGKTPSFESIELLFNGEVVYKLGDPKILEDMVVDNTIRFDTIKDNETILHSSYELPLWFMPELEYRIRPKKDFSKYSNFKLNLYAIKHSGDYNKGVFDSIYAGGNVYSYSNGGSLIVRSDFVVEYK